MQLDLILIEPAPSANNVTQKVDFWSRRRQLLSFSVIAMLVVMMVLLAVACGNVRSACPIKSREDFLQEQARLYKTIFENYNPRLSPISTLDNSTETESAILPRYKATLTLVFLKFIRMVEADQRADFLFEYQMDWVDERLKWIPKDYCNISSMYVRFEDVWIPEITVTESHASTDYREDYRKFAWMNSSGAMGFFVPTLTSTVCTIKVKDFPFDEQRCSINVMAQSFALNEYGIDAVYDPDVLVSSPGRSLGNGEWQVLNISVHKDYVDTGQLINSFEVSRFVFRLKRNPSFYITMVITPSFVINVLSIIGVFLKAADSMGKLGMALTNIMSLTFVLGILATVLPKTEELPKIAIYVVINLSIMVAALAIVLLLPYLKRLPILGLQSDDDIKGEKRKRIRGRTYAMVNFGLFVLLEVANVINFIILVT